MRRRFKQILTAALALSLAAAPAAAFGAQAEKSVNVKLPGFPVIVNGITLDNNYDKYPFIVYNDITYFPMTYSGCRFLGLESEWKGNKEGLSIGKTGITTAFKPYKSTARNGSSYKATVPGFPIKVNGKAIDNSSLKYPLLSFRDITYFPMTWEFGVNAFGWDYSFNTKDGLIIDSDNIKLEQKTMADAVGKREYDDRPTSVTVTDKYIYYEDTKGQIIQAQLAEPAVRKAVYQLPVWSYGNGEYVSSRLYVENGLAYLGYHQGGATMGSDWLIRLYDNGTTDVLQNSYTRTKTFGDKSFYYFTGGAPGPGNLFMKTGGSEDDRLGNPDYLYGWTWTVDEDGAGGRGSDDVYLVEDSLYILAFENMWEKDNTTGIYRIDINTGETVRVSDKEVWAFKLEGDFLYYYSKGIFYRQSIKDGKEEEIRQVVREQEETQSIFALEPKELQNFLVLNGKIYWMKRSDHSFYDIEGKNLNEGAVLDDMAVMGSSGEYLVATFEETDTAKYRIMVFNRDGNAVFKTSDKAYCRNISIFGDKIYFYNLTTGTVCIGRLNIESTFRNQYDLEEEPPLISVVLQGYKDVSIFDSLGNQFSERGESLYLIDDSGNETYVGAVWTINEKNNRKQYVIKNIEFNISIDTPISNSTSEIKVEYMNDGKFIDRLLYDNVNSAYSMNLHVGTNGNTELVTVEGGRIMPLILPQEKLDQMNM